MKKVTDQIIQRAAELWGRKLHNPAFDNGDNSAAGGMTHMLATMNIQSAKGDVGDIVKSVEMFKKELVKSLIAARESGEYFPTWLDTDYHPCKELAEAAGKAGIPGSLFSCKSSVSMYEDSVGTSFGYGAGTVYHYPLPGGKWLITSLRGEDISKIIDLVVSGNDLGLEVE